MKTTKHLLLTLYTGKSQFWIFFLSLFISVLFSVQTNACSTFLLSNGNTFVYGRNFDYPYGKYIIMMNMRGSEKICWQYSPENVDMPLSWTAKYGSITFNMFGHDTPPDGINEAGLVISSLILTQSVYPNTVGESSLSLDQLLQYLLDNCASVNEVIDECSNLNIRFNPFDYWRLHFFVVDKTGQAAVIEFLDGNLVATTADDLEKKAITNSSYQESIAYYHNGKNPSLPETASLNRYYNAIEMVDNYNNENLIDYSYSIMDLIAQRITMRKVVYDIPNMRVYFKSNTNETLRYFDLSNFDFSCTEQPLVYTENQGDEGDISDKFVAYTTEINKTYIKSGWDYLEMTYTEDELNEFAQYPETFGCLTTASEIILDVKQDHQFLVFPNPADQVITISGGNKFDNSVVKISIVNLNGQIVYEDKRRYFSKNNNPIFVKNLPKGIYSVRLTTKNDCKSQRFVKF